MFLPRLTKRLTVKRTVTAPTCVVVPASPVAAGRVCAVAVPAALANEAAHASATIVVRHASTARCLRDMFSPFVVSWTLRAYPTSKSENLASEPGGSALFEEGAEAFLALIARPALRDTPLGGEAIRPLEHELLGVSSRLGTGRAQLCDDRVHSRIDVVGDLVDEA